MVKINKKEIKEMVNKLENKYNCDIKISYTQDYIILKAESRYNKFRIKYDNNIIVGGVNSYNTPVVDKFKNKEDLFKGLDEYFSL